MNANELIKYWENQPSNLAEQTATMLRQQQAEIEALNGEIKIVSKLLIGEPISDDDMEKHWNPLHSTLASKLKRTLTDEEIKSCWDFYTDCQKWDIDFARAILRKAQEK